MDEEYGAEVGDGEDSLTQYRVEFGFQGTTTVYGVNLMAPDEKTAVADAVFPCIVERLGMLDGGSASMSDLHEEMLKVVIHSVATPWPIDVAGLGERNG